jgi:hypothetical protein
MPLRNASGARYLKGLFYEMVNADKTSVMYTLKDSDYLGYPSLYRLYMMEGDVTEYTFATKYLDGFDHWVILCECSWFKPYVAKWRLELETRIRSRALRAIQEVAADETAKESFSANKLLLAGGWKEPGQSKTRGRPTKDDIRKEASKLAQSEKQLTDDYNRIKGLQ